MHVRTIHTHHHAQRAHEFYLLRQTVLSRYGLNPRVALSPLCEDALFVSSATKKEDMLSARTQRLYDLLHLRNRIGFSLMCCKRRNADSLTVMPIYRR